MRYYTDKSKVIDGQAKLSITLTATFVPRVANLEITDPEGIEVLKWIYPAGPRLMSYDLRVEWEGREVPLTARASWPKGTVVKGTFPGRALVIEIPEGSEVLLVLAGDSGKPAEKMLAAFGGKG